MAVPEGANPRQEEGVAVADESHRPNIPKQEAAGIRSRATTPQMTRPIALELTDPGAAEGQAGNRELVSVGSMADLVDPTSQATMHSGPAVEILAQV